MVLTSAQHIDITRRISKAEIKYRETSLKTFGSAAPSSGTKPDPAHKDDDEKVAKIMQGIIAPWLARLQTSYFGLNQPHPISDWWGVNTRGMLEEFGRRLPRSPYICPIHMDYMHVLLKAVELAQAEQPLNNVTWADVFVIHHLYYDPTLKATVDAYWTPSTEWSNLMANINRQILEEPHFPTEGHTLKFTIDSRLPSVFK
ncbi:hypothetical protein FRC01_006315 [Tulasnella sp. 417]|nr:hypothetical protein FRC01_006315 [Tulasnella sp. 417]